METIITYKNAFWTIFVLFVISVFLLTKSCDNSEPSFVKVKIPEETIILKTDTLIKHEIVNVEKWYKDNKNEIKLKQDVAKLYERLKIYEEEVTWMQDEFAHEDSIGKANLYKLSTQLKDFDVNWFDEKYKLNLKGFISANAIKEITPTITRLEGEVDAEVPQLKYRLLVGGGFGINKELNQGIYKINLGYQNSKGNILDAEYLKINTQEYFLIGRDFNIYTRKK